LDTQTESRLDLTALFEDQARAAGASVTRVASVTDAAEAVRTLAGGEVRCATTVEDFFPGFTAALRERGVEVITAGEVARAVRDRADLALGLASPVGLIAADAGIAETGSVLIADDALGNRLVGMLTERCIVVLSAQAILPSLDDAGRRIAELEARGHRYISLVTGPSRTADIERVLTIGVQGPRELPILLMES
jgi:L-lactate dehydrogenase complex protein LldG